MSVYLLLFIIYLHFVATTFLIDSLVFAWNAAYLSQNLYRHNIALESLDTWCHDWVPWLNAILLPHSDQWHHHTLPPVLTHEFPLMRSEGLVETISVICMTVTMLNLNYRWKCICLVLVFVYLARHLCTILFPVIGFLRCF